MKTQPGNRRTHQDGFTLIEVVVALAILGTGMVILLEAQYASLVLFDSAQEEATMSIFLESVIGEAERDVLAGNTDGEGDFGGRFPDYSYTFKATQPDEDNAPGLYEVVVEVHGPIDSREMIFLTYFSDQEQILENQ